MAGDNVYIGEMIAGLQTKIDVMVASMATQTAKLETVATQIIAVGNNTSQNISSIKVEKSDILMQKINLVDKNFGAIGAAITPGTEFEYGQLTCFATGTIRINFSGITVRRYASNTAVMEAKVYAKVATASYGAPVTVSDYTNFTAVNGIVDLAVTAGDVIKLGVNVRSTSASTESMLTKIESGYIDLKYNLKDIISSGGFVLK